MEGKWPTNQRPETGLSTDVPCCGPGRRWPRPCRRCCARVRPKPSRDPEPLPRRRSSIPRSMPTRRTRRSDPGFRVPNWPAHVTGDEMVAAMDKVGVDGAIFVSPFSMYQYDGSYAVEVQRAHPNRVALVKPVNPDDPAVADVIADWKKTPGTVGIRIIM